jgi:hypothetical protein
MVSTLSGLSGIGPLIQIALPQRKDIPILPNKQDARNQPGLSCRVLRCPLRRVLFGVLCS